MINLRDETLIPLREVPARLPRRSNGKRLHISAVYRWTQRGLKGRRLETIKIGGTTYTSIEALQRFSMDYDERISIDSPHTTTHTPHREKQIKAAARRVDELLKPH